MKTFDCHCGARLFFHSTHCVACNSTVGRCASCFEITTFEPSGEAFICKRCHASIRLCGNRTEFEVCNATVPAKEVATLCSFCNLNQIIPELSVNESLEKWRRLERAKHRVLYDCEQLGLPVTDRDSATNLPLRFEFKSSTAEVVSTGHANGVITIELEEADSVRREQTRVEFAEPQRTLVGHFRHELGHYYWQRIVEPHFLDEYRQLFGDERDPNYSEAQQKYYAEGAPVDWRASFISEYASMHSWEDFAETFNAFMDMIAIIGTANHFRRLRVDVKPEDFESLVRAYSELGIVANEFNRDIGLLDLVPEVITPTVAKKLEFIHAIIVRNKSRSWQSDKVAEQI